MTPKILFVSHDANRAGAQLFLYNVMLYLKKNNYSIHLLVLKKYGALQEDFEREFDTIYYSKNEFKNKLLRSFYKNKTTLECLKYKFQPDLIYLNTIASAWALEELQQTFKVPVLSHIHELPYSIQQFGNHNDLDLLARHSSLILGCSEAVTANLRKRLPASQSFETVHSFVDNSSLLNRKENVHKSLVFEKYKISQDKFIVIAVGNADWRKGPDLFVQIARHATRLQPKLLFVWVGMNFESELFTQLKYDTEKSGLSEHIIWIGQTPDAFELVASSDVFLLCSREDPFPLVMLEAAIAQKAIISFSKSGGANEFIQTDTGLLCDYLDIPQMAKNILFCFNNPDDVRKFGLNARNKVLSRFSFENSIKQIEDIIKNISK